MKYYRHCGHLPDEEAEAQRGSLRTCIQVFKILSQCIGGKPQKAHLNPRCQRSCSPTLKAMGAVSSPLSSLFPHGSREGASPSPTTTQSLGSGLEDPSGIVVLCPQDPDQLPSTWVLSHLSPAVSSRSVDVQTALSTSRPTPGRVSRALAHMCPPPGLWADAPLPALLPHPLCCVPLLAPLREPPSVSHVELNYPIER